MIDFLQRLGIPLVLLAAIIGVSIAIGRVGNDELPPIAVAGDQGAPSVDTPVFSIRRAPTLLTSPKANEELRVALTAWAATLPTNSCFVISAGGEVIFEHQPALGVVPASNMKILTAYGALEMLGADYRFTTTVEAAQEPDSEGLLEGDLYVIGGGDPVLMTKAYRDVLAPEDLNTVFTSAEELADQTVAANIIDINGSVLVDESRYDTERSVTGWPERFAQTQAGSLSAALLDDGLEGLKDGYASQVGLADPPPLPRSADPAALFGSNFDDLLEARSVRIFGAAAAATEVPDGLIELASIKSPPLEDIIAEMLVNSDNTTAEMLLKELAVADGQTGSTGSGRLALSGALDDAGLDTTNFFPWDGSGLGDQNTVTCGLVHGALEDPAHKDALRAAMAVAGESGTLADSFLGTPFEGKLRAKTGFLNRASALSGYFLTTRGVEVTFALIINADADISEENITTWQAPLPALLASYPEGPPISELGPKGVVADEEPQG